MELDLFVLRHLVESMLKEDIGTGDITTNSIVPANAFSTGYIISKEAGVICGIPVGEMVFRCLDEQAQLLVHVADGDWVLPGQLLMEVHGRTRAILTGERLALNFLQRLSGIATRTAQLVRLVGSDKPSIIDTRKTTPGLRVLEKYAVRMGGGHNHRFGLYDAVLIKDNHIKAAGGIARAVAAARGSSPHTVKIEVEVESLAGVKEALDAGADIIMLDNMTPVMMREAVVLVSGRALVEASGGITEDSIRTVAATGVDLISVGALTHSFKSLDISLDLEAVKKTIN